MKIIEEQKGIKKTTRIYFVAIAIINMASGVVYGINTGRWASAFTTVLTIQAIMFIFAPLVYMAAMNRLEDYSQKSEQL